MDVFGPAMYGEPRHRADRKEGTENMEMRMEDDGADNDGFYTQLQQLSTDSKDRSSDGQWKAPSSSSRRYAQQSENARQLLEAILSQSVAGIIKRGKAVSFIFDLTFPLFSSCPLRLRVADTECGTVLYSGGGWMHCMARFVMAVVLRRRVPTPRVEYVS